MVSRRTLAAYGLASSVVTVVAVFLFALFLQLQVQFDTFSPIALIGSVLAGAVAYVVAAEGLSKAIGEA